MANLTRNEAFSIGALDAVAQGALVHAGETTPRNLIEAAIIRIESLEPEICALTEHFFETALKEAEQVDLSLPFAGVPVLFKEGVAIEGSTNTSGSRAFAENRDTQTSEIVTRLRAQGFIPLGKTAMPEGGLSAATEPISRGPVQNPWSSTHSPGGSSGGAGASVAALYTPISTGSDGGGSVRIPASCCGVFGYKPSRGKTLNAHPPHRIEDLLVCYHPLTRTVRDSAHALAILEERESENTSNSIGFVREPGKMRLRIGLVRTSLLGETPDGEVVDALYASAKLCENLGHYVEPCAYPFSGEAFMKNFITLWATLAAEFSGAAEDYLGRTPTLEDIEPLTRGLAKHFHTLSSGASDDALQTLSDMYGAYLGWRDTYDIILSPVLSKSAFKTGYLGPDKPIDALKNDLFSLCAYTPLQNAFGEPSMSVPLQWTTEGLPVGSLFSAARNEDRLLLELAYELEAAKPWAHRTPFAVPGVSPSADN